MLFTQQNALAVALLALTSVAVVAADDVVCSDHPPVLPDNYEYKLRCDDSVPKIPIQPGIWPCFTHFSWEYSLLGATIYPSFEDTAPADSSIIAPKDGDLWGFTPRDKSKPFSIRYNFAGTSIHYKPSEDPDCYTLTIDKWDRNSKFMMSILNSGGDRVMDNWNRDITSKMLCLKEVTIDMFDHFDY